MKKKNQDRIKYSSPIIEVTFTSVRGDEFTARSYEFGGIILSIQTQKTINTLPGTFSVTTVGKNNFSEFFEGPKVLASAYELFRPAGLVQISIDGKQIMVGTIDGITKSVTMSERGKPVRSYTIAGRDLGSVLVDHKIWYDDVLYKNRENQSSLMGSKGIVGMVGGEKSGVIMEKVINEWMVDVVNKTVTIGDQSITPFKFADGQEIQDRFVAMRQDNNFYTTAETKTTIEGPGAISDNTYADEYPINFAMSFVGGALSNFLQNFTASPFNEFFVDTGDTEVVLNSNDLGVKKVQLEKGKVYPVFRPAPFDDDNFGIEGIPSKLKMSNLPVYQIDDSIIKGKQLNMNGKQKFGCYFVSPSNQTLTFAQGKLYTPGAYDESALRRYGYSTMNVPLGGYEVSQQDSGKIESLISDFQKKIRSWFQRSDEFLQGSFMIKGDPQVRIGNKLEYIRDEEGTIEDDYEEGYYYITGVSHSWTYGKIFTSNITVSRGISKKIFKKESKRELWAGSNPNNSINKLG